MKRIEVAVGVIFNDRGEVLIGQRTVADEYLGKWEFPGGKLEAGESVEHALVRELREELGITVMNSNHLLILDHDYPDRQVRLHVRTVDSYQGQPVSAEQQALQWIEPEALQGIDFLAGNQPIIQKLL
ncbi:MAG: 8-oxo-dGTP diphosphatase MutT [Pseudomonadota bacterium]